MILLLACSSPEESAAGALDVESAWVSDELVAGASVHVWADLDPRTTGVTGWSMDVDPAGEWNGELVVPDAGTLRPETAAWATFAATSDTLDVGGESRRVRSWTPESPRGTVAFFHGASYNADMLDLPAGAGLVGRLVSAGWTVQAPDSAAATTSGTGGWSSADDDPVRAWLDTLPTPVVVIGMSSGGQFAHHMGAGRAAAVGFCAPGDPDDLATTDAPTAWYLAAADTVFPSAVDDATGAQPELEARGIPTDLHVHPQTPLYDQRFLRVSGVDEITSTSIADQLRASGAWDGAWTGESTAVDVDASIAAEVESEIQVMIADHELYDDASARLVAWLDAVTG